MRARVALFILPLMLSAPLAAQSASLSGSVLLDVGERPLANAEITFTDLKVSTRSDSAGRFLLGGLPAGKHALVVRLVGYESIKADLTFTATQKIETDFLLTASTTKLKKVEVKAKVDERYKIKLAEFEERRKLGMGRYLTAEVFEKENGRPASAFLMAHIPGIKFGKLDGKHILMSGRNGSDGCYVQVIVNGIVIYNGLQPKGFEYDIDAINSSDIIGLEYYTVATTPLQYNGTGGIGKGTACGTVVIWTK